MLQPNYFPLATLFARSAPRASRCFSTTIAHRSEDETPLNSAHGGGGGDETAVSEASQAENFLARTSSLRTGYENLLETFGLSRLSNTSGHGVQIDERGMLGISCPIESKQWHKTALILSRAPLSLNERDFFGLLKKGKHLGRWRSHGGLEKILPWRHLDSLRRRNRWILIFSTPADAAEFQSRAYALRKFLRQHTPAVPGEKPTVSADYEPQDLPGFKMSDYTVGPPFQAPALYAFLSPFPEELQNIIVNHNHFMSYSDAEVSKFAVRLWMDDKSPYLLNQGVIKQWLHNDGKKRHVPWRLSQVDEPIQPLANEPYDDILDPSGPESEQFPHEHNWLVFFQTPGEARRFVRAFHRTRLPEVPGWPIWDTMPLVKAELLLEDPIMMSRQSKRSFS